ncbi:hypothetical protein HRR83_006057 [Exophiala dermatitidis]|uniref:Aminoglycoside phosphotransferase domain-containing protein n=1 Tax=Exophiala dermatitidis TaxID=5970 RepID=A0AAN6IVM0_EXODE|nr:hypothetical protein HRR75_005000 [Exophiala dermatitidis]KAJ4514989.1 hypothetical protein HRR74_005454 [Exophiala dermatitidis]KAJ4517480.1 hypothetical protein HRR73_004532 [Exophiala dermatitidis]KAJ4548766.1 hypothetical protein HRR76_001347 [Exophiala dermatitidis]KAJ4550560.1 hypothetical protein HRR78_004329 [Exophiala dermatitidis]
MPPQSEEQEDATDEGCEWEKPIQDLEEEDDNMLIHMEWDRLEEEFLQYLETERPTIKTIVAQHLNLKAHQTCSVAKRYEWMGGTYNVCIPVFISNWRARRVLIRCPFPHRLGGLHKTTLMEEKLRCEAASFAWLSRNCPRVPIPHLFGFGLPGGLQFSPLEHAPWYQRVSTFLRWCWARACGRSYFRPFAPLQSRVSLKSGYLLIECFEKERGQTLSAVGHPPPEHRPTLFRSLRRILLDLARPLSRIGSFTVHDSGEVCLTNRPLTRGLVVLENAGVPTKIPQNQTYSSTEPYLLDLINCHDQRLIHQPNVARSKLDLEGQMATIVALRALYSTFMSTPLQREPPIFQFTDLHEDNFFVDENYCITGIVDIEFSCALPREMQHPPFWLSGHELDDLDGEGTQENEEKFERACEEFLRILEEEDDDDGDGETFSICPRDYAQAMRDSLRRKQHWYLTAVKVPRIAYNTFVNKIQPQFAFSHSEEEAGKFQDVMAKYWRVDTVAFFEQKRHEWSNHLSQLRSIQSPSTSTPVCVLLPIS